MSQARPLELAGLPVQRPGPDWSWDRAQGSPGLGPILQGLGLSHVSALLSIHVFMYILYVMFHEFMFIHDTFLQFALFHVILCYLYLNLHFVRVIVMVCI